MSKKKLLPRSRALSKEKTLSENQILRSGSETSRVSLQNETEKNKVFGHIKVDIEGNCFWCDNIAAEIFGMESSALCGKNFFTEIAPMAHEQAFKDRFELVLQDPTVSEYFLFTVKTDILTLKKIALEIRPGVRPDTYSLLLYPVNDQSSPSLQGSKFSIQGSGSGFSEPHKPPAIPSRPTMTTSESEHFPETVSDLEGPFAPHQKIAIQSWGALLVVKVATGRIVGVSDNIKDILTLSTPIKLDAWIKHYLPHSALEKLESLIPATKGVWHDTINFQTVFRGGKAQIEVRATEQSGLWYLELFFAEDGEKDTLAGRDLVAGFEAIDKAQTLQQVCDSAVSLIRQFTGFSRILICSFDSDWNGYSVSEDMAPNSLQSLKGLYFPESDISPRARALYHYNRARFMPERKYKEISVQLSDKISIDAAVDLSTTQIRSISKSHRKYHRDIGAEGSMSLSLIVNDRLWGLVIGHSEHHHQLTARERMSAYLLQKAAENRIQYLEAQQIHQTQAYYAALYTSIVESLSGSQDLFDAVFSDGVASISGLFQCSSAAIMMDGDLKMKGKSPSGHMVRRLISKSFGHAESDILVSRCLKQIDPAFEQYARYASGALIVFPGGSDDLAVVWFFPEIVETLTWAGNPYGLDVIAGFSVPEKQEEVSGKRLKRLKKWTEVTSARSRNIGSDIIAFARKIGKAISSFNSQRSSRLSKLAADLNDANNRFISILDNMAEGVLVLDTDLQILSTNLGMRYLLNRRRREMNGKSVTHLMTSSGMAILKKAISNLHQYDQKEDNVNLFKVDFVALDKTLIPAEVSLGAWLQEGEQCLVLVVRDLRALETLQKMTDTRTKMEALGQFSSSITHDFNNFLSIISANIELAQLANTNPTVSQRLTAAHHAVRRGSELTDRLLSIVRERPDLPYSSEVSRLLKDNLGVFKSALGERITLTLHETDPSPWILVHKGQLENAILNLLNNARDAISGIGYIKLILETEWIDGLSFLRLTVQDNGRGMSPEVLEKALEPFFTTKMPGKGTGLGLVAISRMLEQMKGHLSMESELGKGTSIIMTIPCSFCDDYKDMPGRTTVLQSGLLAGKILLVDDDRAVLDPVAELLRQDGLTVLEVFDPEEALKILVQDRSITVLLSDVNLNHTLSGIDLTRMVADDFPTVTPLLMSGDQGQKLVSDLDTLSISFLPKPFSLKQFYHILARLVSIQS